MSLFQRALAALEGAVGATEAYETRAELAAAHAASVSLLPGDGKRIVISGSKILGFLVEIHDGIVFSSYGMAAEDEVDAMKQALERFASEPRPAPEPVEMPAPMPLPVLDPKPVEEHPFAGDPGTVDVTRGRPSDDARDLDAEEVARRAGPPSTPGEHLEAAEKRAEDAGNVG